MKYCTIAAGALGLTTTDLLKIDEALGKTGTGLYNSDPTAPHVVWLPGQACTGCTMALTNSVFYTTVGSLVLNDINLDYSETLAAASGDKIVASAISTIGKTMVFVAEGAIPHGGTGDVNEKFCTVWSRSGGIIAAGSKLYSGTNPTVYAAGTLVGTSSMTIDANSIIAAGSELVEGTTLPAGTVVESAGDRAVMKAAPFLASFNTSISSSYGTDRTNANIKITGTAVTVVGDANAIPSTGIEITGGTDASNSNGQTTNQGSILAGGALSNGTFLSAGTIVTSSFDRLYLSAESATVGVGVNTDVVATFQYAGTANDWKLTNNLIITNTNGRAVSGPMILDTGSIIAINSSLKAGTKVPDPADQASLISNSGIATLFNGYGDTGANAVYSLAGNLSIGTDEEILLTGKVTLPALTPGDLGGTPQEDKTMLHESRLFATSAAAVLCVGTCSSFGGIPAAKGNRTGASGVLYTGLTKAGKYNGALKEFAYKTVNISGCPPHPDWIVGTIAYLLKTNYQIPELEAYARPMAYYGQYQCNAGPCEWRYNQGYSAAEEKNYFAPRVNTFTVIPSSDPEVTGQLPRNLTTVNSSKLYKYKWDNSSAGNRYLGCIGVLGCKGRKTKADCSLRRWNGNNSLVSGSAFYGVNWCVGSGAGCHGCTEPTFPDKVGKFFNFA